MATTATYSHYYTFNTDPRGLSTYSVGANPTPNTLEDDEDLTDDGVIALNGAVSWSETSGITVIGVTDAGWPVLFESSINSYYIATNDGGLFNTPLVINSTGYTMCFAAGTLIATPGGDSAVEDLSIGDLVSTSDNSVTAVKWVGRQTVHKLFAGARLQPVRISKGALGNGLPHSDLTVTADHGMVIDGLVINASALVNGTTIDFVPMAELQDSYTVYHIETEAHDVILANGTASETFIDVAGRAAFDNYAEYLDLYGTERIIPEMRNYRITSQRLLPEAIKARLGITEPAMPILDLSLSA